METRSDLCEISCDRNSTSIASDHKNAIPVTGNFTQTTSGFHPSIVLLYQRCSLR